MSRKVAPVAAIIVLLMTGIALAQVVPLPDNKEKPTKKEQERAAADKAYQDASKLVPAPKTSVDPWGTVRPSPPAAAKNKQ